MPPAELFALDCGHFYECMRVLFVCLFVCRFLSLLRSHFLFSLPLSFSSRHTCTCCFLAAREAQSCAFVSLSLFVSHFPFLLAQLSRSFHSRSANRARISELSRKLDACVFCFCSRLLLLLPFTLTRTHTHF